MVIAATGATSWPLDIIEMAEELVVKWEDGLGPLKNLRADLYGPGGRLEGVRKITNWRDGARERDDVTILAMGTSPMGTSPTGTYSIEGR